MRSLTRVSLIDTLPNPFTENLTVRTSFQGEPFHSLLERLLAEPKLRNCSVMSEKTFNAF